MRLTTLLACLCLSAFFAVALGACGASNQPANDQTTVTVTPPDSAAPATPSAPAPAPAASH